MSLDKDVLIDGLREILDPTYGGDEFPSSIDAAREAWTNIYDTYALFAEDMSGDSLTASSRSGFKDELILEASLDEFVPVASPAADLIAEEFAKAFVAYWEDAAFAILTTPDPDADCVSDGGNLVWASETTSVVSVVNSNPLEIALAAEFRNISTDGAAKAEAFATIFHKATTEDVTVLITGVDTTSPTPLPITNTCTIF